MTTTSQLENPIPANQQNGNPIKTDLFSYTREIKSAPTPSRQRSDSISTTSSMSSISSPKKKKKLSKNKSSCSCSLTCTNLFYFFFGHAPQFTKLSSRTSSKVCFFFLFFIETSFRSIGDVTFCSNPFSGLLIFVAMFISNPQVTLLGFITLAFGIMTAALLRIPTEEVRSGGVLFNNFLTGTVIGLLASEDVILSYPLIIPVCIGIGILTVFIWRGLNGQLASNFEFPLLNAPFHLIILLYTLSGIAANFNSPSLTPSQVTLKNLTQEFDISNITNSSKLYKYEMSAPTPSSIPNTSPEPLDLEKVFYGICLAPSQVFGTKDVSTSLLIYASILLYSPIMMVQSLTGAAIGTLIGICLSSPEEYSVLYNGSWGYNPLFTSAALGGFFIIFNLHSWLLSIVGSILTGVVYAVMVKCNIPPYGIPFMLTTWLLLPSFIEEKALSSSANLDTRPVCKNGSYFRIRLPAITTPELNFKLFTFYDTNKYTQKGQNQGGSELPSTPQSNSNSILPL